MKIGTIRPRITIIAMAVFAIFAIFLAYAYIISNETRLLLWGIPTLVLLLVIPAGLNYMSQKEYEEIRPKYEREARSVRIKLINLNMVGEPVRIEGIIEKAHFQFLNRPSFTVADRSGEISVKMYTHPGETFRVGDIVEVLGMVMKRYIAAGGVVVNGVSMKKIDKVIDVKPKKMEK